MNNHDALIAMAKDLGVTAECAAELIAEHIARINKKVPRYAALALNRASSVNGGRFEINCAKTQKYLDREFGWNAENIHDIAGFTVNRDKVLGSWYVV